MKMMYFRFFLLAAVFCAASSGVLAQGRSENRTFCNNSNWSSDNRVSVSDLREIILPARSLVTVDGNRNGGISVKGSDRSDILVRSCVQAWANSDEAARDLARGIRIDTGAVIRAESSTGESNWSVSYEILVPRAANLKLSTYNGGISISRVEGNLEFEAHNGGLHLSDLAGNVRGRTTNGGVNVKLSGSRWKGSGLDVQTTNGGVDLNMPENYAADLETGTVNGGFKSDISIKVDLRDGWDRSKRIRTDLNGGGPPIRVVTTNGGIRINSTP